MPDGKEQSAPQADAAICAEFFKALADPVRLQIVKALRSGPLSVSDLALLLDREISTISHHLRILYHAKLVGTERDGKFIYYHLNPVFLKRSTVGKSLDFGCCKVELRS